MKNNMVFIFLSVFIISNSIFAKKYKGAEYRTKASYTYGRFEVSYKPANREGVISSFFTYHDGSQGWNEIDIEFNGRYVHNIQFNTITNGQKFHIRKNYIDFNPYEDFHTYAFEWTPDYIAWFIDSVEVYRQTGDFVQTVTLEQKLMMNIWNPEFTNWVGTWNDNSLPAFAYYDWISYSKYTPGSGSSGTNSDFTNVWIDELDSLDSSRWESATHTFAGNRADFIKENVVFENGKMVLCLTNETELGLTDNIKPEVLWARVHQDKSIKIMFSEEVEKSTAENIANYIIPNKISGILSNDKKYVTLFTSDYDINSDKFMAVYNIADDSPNSNIMTLKSVPVFRPHNFDYPVKINVGGDSLLGYLGDQEFTSQSNYGYLEGDAKTWNSSIEINGTDEDDLFRTERKGLAAYKIRVPNGNYDVELNFAENDNNLIGDRVFDIVADGNEIVKNLDIYSLAGKSNLYTLKFNTNVDDEIIDIYFSEQIDSSFINTIVVNQISVGLNHETNLSPTKYILNQNYPNPFNPSTTISYSFKDKNESQRVKLIIFDSLGEEITTLVNRFQQSGKYKVEFNAENLSSGIYYYQLEVGHLKQVKKMLLLK